MSGDASQCTYGYADALYWDARYTEDGNAAFDWYQRYEALRPFVRHFVPASSRVLMVGCGNAVMSEDMVKDGYMNIINIDISSVVIDMMRKKYAHIPELKYMQMDVRDMDEFEDVSFDCIIDKGTLDSLLCGTDAALSSSQMIEEVNRILRPGGIYIMITYGDPSVRLPHIKQEGYNWKIMLYIIPRPGYESRTVTSSSKSIMEPVQLTENGQLPADFVLEDPDSHYIYICQKIHEY